MATIAEVQAILTLQNAQFMAAMQQSQAQASASFAAITAAIEKSADDQEKSIWKMIGGYALLKTAWGELKWIGGELSDSMDRMFRTAKDAVAFQATTQELNALEYAAQRAGTNLGKVEQTIGALEKSVGMALSSGKQGDKQRNILAQLGLDPASLAQGGGVDALSQVAVALNKVGSAAQQESMLAGLMSGSRGKQLASSLSLIYQLKNGIIGLTEEMQRYYGVSNSEQAYAKIELAKEATIKLQWVWRGIVDMFTVEIAPVIYFVQKRMEDLGITGEKISGWIEGGFKRAIPVIASVASGVDILSDVLDGNGVAWDTLTLQAERAAWSMLDKMTDLARQLPAPFGDALSKIAGSFEMLGAVAASVFDGMKRAGWEAERANLVADQAMEDDPDRRWNKRELDSKGRPIYSDSEKKYMDLEYKIANFDAKIRDSEAPPDLLGAFDRGMNNFQTNAGARNKNDFLDGLHEQIQSHIAGIDAEMANRPDDMDYKDKWDEAKKSYESFLNGMVAQFDAEADKRAAENAQHRAGAMDIHNDHTDSGKHKELGLAGRLGSMQSVWALTQQHSHLDSTQENTKAVKELTHAIKKGSHVGGQRQGAILHP